MTLLVRVQDLMKAHAVPWRSCSHGGDKNGGNAQMQAIQMEYAFDVDIDLDDIMMTVIAMHMHSELSSSSPSSSSIIITSIIMTLDDARRRK